MTYKNNQDFEVIGKMNLMVPHEEGRLNFIYPTIGKGTFIAVAKEVSKHGLILPTAYENASLLNAVLKNPNTTFLNDLRNKITETHDFSSNIWCNNGILSVPNEGLYIQDNPLIVNRKIVMEKSSLIKRLEENDPSVRFVPLTQDHWEMERNFQRALFGEKGLEKISEVAGFMGNEIRKRIPDLFSNYKWSVDRQEFIIEPEAIEVIKLRYNAGCFGSDGSLKVCTTNPHGFEDPKYKPSGFGYVFGIDKISLKGGKE